MSTKVKIVCPNCGSDEVGADAFAKWSVADQDWVLDTVYDSKTCFACDYEGDAFDEVEID